MTPETGDVIALAGASGATGGAVLFGALRRLVDRAVFQVLDGLTARVVALEAANTEARVRLAEGREAMSEMRRRLRVLERSTVPEEGESDAR